MVLIFNKSITIVLFVVLCLDIATYVNGCNTDCGHYHFEEAFQRMDNRKVKASSKVDIKNGYVHEDSSTKIRVNQAWSELRWVPSGPDPLHHNEVPPKRPRTP